MDVFFFVHNLTSDEDLCTDDDDVAYGNLCNDLFANICREVCERKWGFLRLFKVEFVRQSHRDLFQNIFDINKNLF